MASFDMMLLQEIRK